MTGQVGRWLSCGSPEAWPAPLTLRPSTGLPSLLSFPLTQSLLCPHPFSLHLLQLGFSPNLQQRNKPQVLGKSEGAAPLRA